MLFLNFLVLFLQESRIFFGNIFGEQSRLLVIAVLGLQFMIFFIDVSFNSSKFYVPKVSLLLFLFVTIYFYNHFALHIVFIIMSIVNLRKISLITIVKYTLIIHIFFLFVLLTMLLLGTVHDEIWPMIKGAAHTLGFYNPNSTSKFLNEIILILSFYLLLSNKPFFLNFLLIVPGYFIYRLTYGRTYFIGLAAYYLFLILFRCKFFYKHNYWLYKIAPVLLGSVLIAGVRLYERYPRLDQLFSRRFSFSKQIIDGFSKITLFLGSSYIPEGLTIDCSYLYIFCEAGLISIFCFMVLYLSFVKKSGAKEAKIFFPFVFCVLVAGFAEITFPVFSGVSVVFYKILYQTAAKCSNKRCLR